MFASDQLATLLAVVDTGTFDSAARRLRITPSAVSQRIRALENSTGQVLLRRTAPVATTDAGAVLLRLARQTALLEEDAQRELHRDLRRGDEGDGSDPVRTSIPMAVNADSLATWFLGCLPALADDLDVLVELHRDDQERTADLLRSGAVLAAVTATAEPVQGCTSHPLGIMRYHAVVARSLHERYFRDGFDPGRLAEVPRIDFDGTDDLQRGFLRDLGVDDDANAAPSPRHLVPASTEFARSVELGLGWALLPEQQCRRGVDAGELVELAPAHPRDVALHWQRWNLASPLLDAVTDVVVAAASRALLRL